jgi:hypothetical protein
MRELDDVDVAQALVRKLKAANDLAFDLIKLAFCDGLEADVVVSLNRF